MDIYSSKLYLDDIQKAADCFLPWEKLQSKNILISGATGLIGSFLVDVLMTKNQAGMNCTVYAMCRNGKQAQERFGKWRGSSRLVILSHDIVLPLSGNDVGTVDYVLHLASNTHPLQYATDPIGTITTNVIGLRNMLDYAAEHHTLRFAFASSNEVYGENRGDTEFFGEEYCGYLDSNTLRAGYPESKRCGEALCQAYIAQKGLDVVIPRLTRSYGPTMRMNDSKAISQFIRKAVDGEDIVLKSAGNQYYSYTYAADAVTGLLSVLLSGKKGEAYNIADPASDTTLKELAALIAGISGTNVIFEKPDDVEAAGYSKATKARLDGEKVRRLGWSAKYNLNDGLARTITVLREMK